MPKQAAFLTPNQLERVRDIPLLGMTTLVTIERRSDATPDPDNDYGDDMLGYTTTNESRRMEVRGWFFSTPTPQLSVDTGQVVTANTYRLFLPVGTDILPGDHVHVGSAPDDYTVSDTTAESTWLPLLTCSLRRRE